MTSPRISKKEILAKRAARLAVIQEHYAFLVAKREFEPGFSATAILDESDDDKKLGKGYKTTPVNLAFAARLQHNLRENSAEINRQLEENNARWQRCELILRAIVETALADLMKPEDETPLLISEYCHLASLYYEKEVGLVNGLLEEMGRQRAEQKP